MEGAVRAKARGQGAGTARSRVRGQAEGQGWWWQGQPPGAGEVTEVLRGGAGGLECSSQLWGLQRRQPAEEAAAGAQPTTESEREIEHVHRDSTQIQNDGQHGHYTRH